ncbi:alpha/beta fold hydrolase [Ornithinimicrobium sp. Y1847]|uniref:alpha/beta fold hydrolase n=1 Tax=Ornithinimicrobium sp. Y1847 TaxID=3405419 RepID=UPI003B671CC8
MRPGRPAAALRGLRARPWLAALLVLALVAAFALTWWATRESEAPEATPPAESFRVDVAAEPDGTPVSLTADLYLPDGPSPGPHPAVLLAHGFGGSAAGMREQAEQLREEGYAVLAWSARGFYGSGGRVHLNDPDLEIADISTLIDLLAERDDILQDGPGDPRVAVVGASYGGAAALMAAGTDQRVDTVAASITYHDLAEAFFPQNGQVKGSAEDEPGPLKAIWASTFFSMVGGGQPLSTGGDAADGLGGGSGTLDDADLGAAVCGRFDPQLCAVMLEATDSGRPSQELLDLLTRRSPAAVIDGIPRTTPVYLVQGMDDTLFGLDHATRTADQLRERDVPVAVRWADGGHGADQGGGQGGAAQAADDGSADQSGGPGEDFLSRRAAQAAAAEREAQHEALVRWLRATLVSGHPGTGEAIDRADRLPLPALTYAQPRSIREEHTTVLDVGPAGLASPPDPLSLPVALNGANALQVPPGGTPTAMSTLPGFGAVLSGVSAYPLAALPGQHLTLDTAPLAQDQQVAGSPTLPLRITSSAEETTLFLSLWEVPGEGLTPLSQRSLVAPVRVATTPGVPTEVTVQLPEATYSASAGSRWRVLVAATDGSFRNETAAALVQVEPAGDLVLPQLGGTRQPGPGPLDGQSIALIIALGAVWAGLGVTAYLLRRRRIQAEAPVPTHHETPVPTHHATPDQTDHETPDQTEPPLVVDGLVKSYPDGHRAVDDVSWVARRGQVVGLLGPNGAGKTTTIRMVLGLISPDQGGVRLLGRQVTPGSPALRQVGALVEGPGFLPHLTGRANLHAYWAATGRPLEEAHLDEALAVAALGDALERPVRSYSHGMKQRLGIAQAMLGLPEVLILDEPTNGLDPPQIAALRPILQRYADAGRCVVVSSHLLAEVEMTCSHVVVMHAGRVLAAGSVEEVGVSSGRSLEEVFMNTIAGASGAGDGTDLTELLRQVRAR